MTRSDPLTIALANLRGDIAPGRSRVFLGKERAIALLKDISGQDFGDDVTKWEEWVAANRRQIIEKEVEFGRKVRERRAKKSGRKQ